MSSCIIAKMIITIDAKQMRTYRSASIKHHRAHEVDYQARETDRIQELPPLEFPWPRDDEKVSPNTTLAASLLPVR